MRVRLCLAIGAAIALLTAPTRDAVAQFPSTMNVQGQLTDSTGVPVNTNKATFGFSIWNAQIAGDRIWPKGSASEDQSLPTDADGLWGTTIGNTEPLSADVFTGEPVWLQIEIDDGDNPPQTLSRIDLVAVPHAYRAQAAWLADSAVVAGDASRLDGLSSGDFAASGHNHNTDYVNTSGDAMTGPLQVPQVDLLALNVGDVTSEGELNLKQAGDGSDVVHAYSTPGLGGAVDLYDEAGNITVMAQPDYEGRGGLLKVSSGGGGLYGFLVDGEQSPTDSNVFVWMLGTASNCQFNTNRTGDASVVLPAGAISATEQFNEPGISFGTYYDFVSVHDTAAMTDIVTTTITIPAAGYIVVEVDSYVGLLSTTSPNIVIYQIDETAGGARDSTHGVVGMASPPNIQWMYYPVAKQRVYYKPSAGSYTFRFEAMSEFADGGQYFEGSTIRATYYPTSYGSVSGFVSDGESGGTGHRVDLRDLELRAAREKAEYEQAQRELLEAKLAEQLKASTNRRNTLQ